VARSLQHEMEDLVARAVTALRDHEGDNLVSCVLFGSVARRTAGPGSDIDLVLVFRELPAERHERFLVFYRAWLAIQDRIVALARDGVAFDFSPLILTVEEARHHSPLYLDMVDEAVFLRDVGGFFAGVLDGLRARMRELGTRRIVLPDGSSYWELKPGARPGEVIEL
jgi:predicted nucleotidyltransferase